MTYISNHTIAEGHCSNDQELKPRLGIHHCLEELRIRPLVRLETSLSHLRPLRRPNSLSWVEKSGCCRRVWEPHIQDDSPPCCYYTEYNKEPLYS